MTVRSCDVMTHPGDRLAARRNAALDADHPAKPTTLAPGEERICVTCGKSCHGFLVKMFGGGEPEFFHGAMPSGAEYNARILAEQQSVADRHRRLVETYGEDGYQAISELAARFFYRRPAAPEDRGWAWAESTWLRERTLDGQ